MRLPEVGQSGAISWTPRLTGRGLLLQVTVILGASQDVIPQLKEKYDVDTLDMVFIDHWKDRYLPDTLLLEVSLCQPPRSGPAEGGWGAVGWPVCSRDTGVGAWAGRVGLREHRWMACICGKQQMPPLEVGMSVAQSCPAVTYGLYSPGSSVHEILQGDLPDLGIEPGFPALQPGSLPPEPPGKACCPCQLGT